MSKLPSAKEVLNGIDEEHVKVIYSTVLDAESAAVAAVNAGGPPRATAGHGANLVYSRVVGYLILYPLNHQARVQVVKEVIMSRDIYAGNLNESIYELGKHYTLHFIRPCTPSFSFFQKKKIRQYSYVNVSIVRKEDRPTPHSSQHVSAPSFCRPQDEIVNDLLQHSPLDGKTARYHVWRCNLFRSVLNC